MTSVVMKGRILSANWISKHSPDSGCSSVCVCVCVVCEFVKKPFPLLTFRASGFTPESDENGRKSDYLPSGKSAGKRCF